MSHRPLIVACFSILISPLIVIAQETEEPSTVNEGFVAAEIVDKDWHWQAPYPGGAARANRSGAVELFYIVDTSGKPTEIVVGAYTNEVFIKNAIKTLKHVDFKSAQKNGKPVSSADRQIFRFAGHYLNQKVVDRFNTHYERFTEEFIKPEPSRKLLDKHLKKMRGARQANPSNQAILNYANLIYAEKYLSRNEQIMAANVTDAFELNGLDVNKRLEVKRKLVAWLVEEGRYGDALTSIQSSNFRDFIPKFTAGKNSNLDGMYAAALSLQEFKSFAPQLRKMLDPDTGVFAKTRKEIEALKRSDQVFTSHLEVTDRGYELRRLLRNRFAIDQVNGQIDELLFRCEAKFHRLAFDMNQDYQLPESWGNCQLQVNGAVGTQARLIEG